MTTVHSRNSTFPTTRLAQFRRLVWNHYRRHGRDFPWRRSRDPYAILVSEIMLQQTQVSRVIGYFLKFLSRFPDINTLAKASVGVVLHEWQGLGYNRRALYLKRIAEIVIREYKGKLPKDPALLEQLPGIGKGTAGSILAFAYNMPTVFIETNIRRAFIHFFFPKRKKVGDKEIISLIEKTLDKKNSREWYFALMDYGAMLALNLSKNSNPNRRSKHYAKQAKFEGSLRQIRGRVLAMLISRKKMNVQDLLPVAGGDYAKLKKVIHALVKEGFIIKNARHIKV